MLVLTRKCQEAVVVGGTGGFEPLVSVTVLAIDGHSVRLGFEADRDVPVHRWEVWCKLQDGHPNGAPADALQRLPVSD